MRSVILVPEKEGKMSRVGLVIPVYKTDFVIDCITSLKAADEFEKLIVCIVNDGQESVREYLKDKTFPENVYVNHLPENVQFAAANNAGWDFILKKFPDIQFLASLNDDTIVRKNWLSSLLNVLDAHRDIGMIAPVMESPAEDGGSIACQSFKLNRSNKPIALDGYVEGVKYVTALSGFCFVVQAKLLKDIGFLDPLYRNSCEDIDLCIKVQNAGYRIALVDDSRVLHLEESSRFDEGTQTSTGRARRRLRLKWGKKLTGKKSVCDHIAAVFIKYVIDR